MAKSMIQKYREYVESRGGVFEESNDYGRKQYRLVFGNASCHVRGFRWRYFSFRYEHVYLSAHELDFKMDYDPMITMARACDLLLKPAKLRSVAIREQRQAVKAAKDSLKEALANLSKLENTSTHAKEANRTKPARARAGVRKRASRSK